MPVRVHRTQRLVHLDELAVRETPDDAGLDAVLEHLAVVLLEPEADAVGQHVRQCRQEDDADAAGPGHGVEADVELVGDDVVATGDQEPHVEGQRHGAQGGAHRHVARTLEQVVGGGVAGHLALDHRVERQGREHEPRNDHGRPEERRDGVVAGQVDVPRREDPGRSVEEHDVPVRLGRRGHLGRVVGPPQPHRVDLHESTEGRAHTEDDEQQPRRLAREGGEEAVAHDVVLGATRAGELGVLLLDEDQQVHRDQRQEDRRDQQHVRDVEAADDLLADVVPVEDREVRPRPDHRDGEQDRADDPEAGAGQQVVGQRVTGDAHEQRQHQHHDADQPVALPRPAEGAGEEDTEQVDHDRGHEQQRRPVVQLAHEQAAAHVEGQVQRRVVGRRHLHAPQWRVGPLVDDLTHRGVEEERQVGARQQQDDEGVERDLTEQERPVVGKDLVERPAQGTGDDQPVVELQRCLTQLGGRSAWCHGGASHQMRSRFQ